MYKNWTIERNESISFRHQIHIDVFATHPSLCSTSRNIPAEPWSSSALCKCLTTKNIIFLRIWTIFKLIKSLLLLGDYSNFVFLIQTFSSLLIASLCATALAYPDARIDQRIPGWTANGRVTYAFCRPGDFTIDFSETHTEWRGACLITEVSATLFKDDGQGESVRAKPYYSSGTSFSQYEIVNDPNLGFCVRRVGTECSEWETKQYQEKMNQFFQFPLIYNGCRSLLIFSKQCWLVFFCSIGSIKINIINTE